MYSLRRGRSEEAEHLGRLSRQNLLFTAISKGGSLAGAGRLGRHFRQGPSRQIEALGSGLLWHLVVPVSEGEHLGRPSRQAPSRQIGALGSRLLWHLLVLVSEVGLLGRLFHRVRHM